jgi:hypothetical protein
MRVLSKDFTSSIVTRPVVNPLTTLRHMTFRAPPLWTFAIAAIASFCFAEVVAE